MGQKYQNKKMLSNCRRQDSTLHIPNFCKYVLIWQKGGVLMASSHLFWWRFLRKIKMNYFNQINFREIKFRVFANFYHFCEIKTHKNSWDCWLSKLNPPENFWNCIFAWETSRSSSVYCNKWPYFSCFQPHLRN